MASKKIAGAVLASTILLSACAADGKYGDKYVDIPVHTTFGDATIVVYNEARPAQWVSIVNDYHATLIVPGLAGLTPQQKDAVDILNVKCGEFVTKAYPNAAVQILTDASIGAAFGIAYGGVVSAVDAAFHGVEWHNSAAVGSSYFLGYAANGLISLGTKQGAHAACVREIVTGALQKSGITGVITGVTVY